MEQKLRKPFKSTRKNKKYDVFVKKDGKIKKISFGQLPYTHFRDKIGVYSNMDTNDKEQRKRYLARHGKATDNNSSKWFSHKYLWGV